VLGEAVVVVALETADANWRPESAAAAVLGFAAWLYLDRPQVVLGPTPAPLIYSYAHLPHHIGTRGDERWCGSPHRAGRRGSSRNRCERRSPRRHSSFPGFTRCYSVRTVSGPRRVGISLNLGPAAIIVGLILAESALPPVVLAGEPHWARRLGLRGTTAFPPAAASYGLPGRNSLIPLNLFPRTGVFMAKVQE
jgi:hypothetical protein